MKEAFEKIIDELKQESIIVDDDAGHRAVDIIEQIAEEYNNGWIPCSERLHLEPYISCDRTKTGCHYKIITHGDKIRSMSDEELAELLDSVDNGGIRALDVDYPCDECTQKTECEDCFKEWLQSEAEE